MIRDHELAAAVPVARRRAAGPRRLHPGRPRRQGPARPADDAPRRPLHRPRDHRLAVHRRRLPGPPDRRPAGEPRRRGQAPRPGDGALAEPRQRDPSDGESSEQRDRGTRSRPACRDPDPGLAIRSHDSLGRRRGQPLGAPGSPRRRSPRGRSAVTAVVGELLDDRLHLGLRAGVGDDPAQPRDLVRLQRAVPRERSRSSASAGGAASSARATSTGALALDQVVARGLAGGGGVAEDAEQVVAQLERLAQRQAERRQRRPGSPDPRRPGRHRCGSAARWSTWRTCSAARSSRCRRRLGRAPAPRRRGTARRPPRSGTGRRPPAPGPPAPAAGRSGAAARRTRTAAGRRAGSRRRRRTAPGRRASRPRGARSRSARWVAGRPRRVSEASMQVVVDQRARRAAARGTRRRAPARPRRPAAAIGAVAPPAERRPGTACRRRPTYAASAHQPGRVAAERGQQGRPARR